MWTKLFNRGTKKIYAGTKLKITDNKTNIQEQNYLWGYA
jgi:hypothetical protein